MPWSLMSRYLPMNRQQRRAADRAKRKAAAKAKR